MQQQIIDLFNPVLIAYFSSLVMEAVVPFKLCGIINNEQKFSSKFERSLILMGK